MWGTSSPDGKLTGDLRNAIESTEIDGIRMIERTYSKHIGDHSEPLVRRALLDAGLLTDKGFATGESSPNTAP
jgi:hypothetical protein